MENIITFLMGVEKTASQFYFDTAEYFSSSLHLSKFLLSLAEDEKWHYQTLVRATEFLKKSQIKLESQIELDQSLKSKIISPFEHNQSLLKQKKITESDVLLCIINSEYSEWNDLFLYVMVEMTKLTSEFKYIAAKMQNHLKEIEKYLLDHHQNNSPIINQFQAINKIWNYRILIIDDDEASSFFLIEFLKKHYQVASASNGKEGLALINKHYFDLIISDVEMPIMTGIELYEKLEQNQMHLKNKIIFMTGNPGYQTFFEKNQLKYVNKPFTITQLLKKVQEIILKTEKGTRE